jgi:hypothetical protein
MILDLRLAAKIMELREQPPQNSVRSTHIPPRLIKSLAERGLVKSGAVSQEIGVPPDTKIYSLTPFGEEIFDSAIASVRAHRSRRWQRKSMAEPQSDLGGVSVSSAPIT